VFPHLEARIRVGREIPHSKDSLSLLMVQYSKETCEETKTTTLLLYPSLESHCPRCTQVHDPGHRRFTTATCAGMSHDGPRQGFLPCNYISGYRMPKHARRYCGKINLRCFTSLFRGHADVDNVCKDREINLELFKEAAGVSDGSPKTGSERKEQP
jgi:hypothetical protein